MNLQEQIKKIIKESFDRETYSGNYVNRHIIDITPHKDDLPLFFFNPKPLY